MVAHICQTNKYLVFGLTNYKHSIVFYYERQKECLLVYIQTALLTLVYTQMTLLTLMYTQTTLLTLVYTQTTLKIVIMKDV
jgi:hypothetical protein